MPCHGLLSGSRCDPVAETGAEPDSFPIRLVFPTLTPVYSLQRHRDVLHHGAPHEAQATLTRGLGKD